MHWTQTFMSGKLTEGHQSNVLDWITENLDPQEPATIVAQINFFCIYAIKRAIINHFKTGKIISDYHHPQYSKHDIMPYCQTDKMMGLVALHVDISRGDQLISGLYFADSVKMCHWQHLVENNAPS